MKIVGLTSKPEINDSQIADNHDTPLSVVHARRHHLSTDARAARDEHVRHIACDAHHIVAHDTLTECAHTNLHSG
jgi:hypothetical protein